MHTAKYIGADMAAEGDLDGILHTFNILSFVSTEFHIGASMSL
jgi:hypothetical protein